MLFSFIQVAYTKIINILKAFYPNSTVVELLTREPKIKGLNPARNCQQSYIFFQISIFSLQRNFVLRLMEIASLKIAYVIGSYKSMLLANVQAKPV